MSGAKEGAERLVTPGEAIGLRQECEQEQVPNRRRQHYRNQSRLGKEKQQVTSVDPIHSAYMPRSGDLVSVLSRA